MHDYYDKQGNEITPAEWLAKHNDPVYQTVAVTQVGTYIVSTVWLGLNHAHFDGDEPLIFETMIFGIDWEDDVEDTWRYSTESGAVIGHTFAVEVAKKLVERDANR